MEKAFGKRIQFVEPSQPVPWQALSHPGHRNAIILNARSDKPMMALIGHELGHNMSHQTPFLYERLQKAVREMTTMPEGYEAHKLSLKYEKSKIFNEWVNDVIGTRMDEPQFWREVGKVMREQGAKRPTLERVVREVTGWMDRLGERMKKLLPGSRGEGVVKELDRLRRAVAEILIDYQKGAPHPENERTSRAQDVEMSTAGPEEAIPAEPKQKSQAIAERLATVATNALEKLKDTGNKLRHGSAVPGWANEINEKSRLQRRADVDEAEWVRRSLSMVIGKDEAVRAKVSRALEGDEAAMKALPDKVRNVTETVRSLIDQKTYSLLRQLGDTLSPELKDKLGTNLGQYLRRSYRIFEDPEGQRAAITPEMEKSLIDRMKKEWGFDDEKATKAYNDFIDRKNLNSGALGGFLSGSNKMAGKNVTSLMQRKDLWPEMRAVLGEYTEPVDKANNTLLSQSALLRNDVAQKAIVAEGLKTGDLHYEAKPGDVEFQPSAETGRRYDRFKGLYADSRFRDKFFDKNTLFGTSGESMGLPGKLFHSITMGTNQALVVLSPKAYAPQFLADFTGNFRNGRLSLNYRNHVAGWNEALRSLGVINPEAITKDEVYKLRQSLMRQGIMGTSVGQGVLTPLKKGQNLLEHIPGYRALSERAARVFGGTADAAKVPGFISEMARYKDAFAEAHPDWTDAQVTSAAEDRAGEVVRGTSHYYESLPPVVRATGKYVPGINYFANFAYNVWRTNFNTVRFGIQDLNEGMRTNNRELTKIGLVRLTAAAAYYAGLGYLAEKSAGTHDQREAVSRSFVPKYDKGGSVSYMEPPTADKVRYFPHEYIDPDTMVVSAIRDALSSKTPKEAMASFAESMKDQFGGDNPVYQAFSQTLTNTDEQGNPITYPQDQLPYLKRAGYFMGHTLTPSAVPFVRNVFKGARGEQSASGTNYTTADMLESLAGVRVRNFSPTARIPGITRDAVNEINTIQQGFNSAARAKNATPEAIAEARGRAQTAMEEVYGKLYNLRDDYLTLPGGTPEKFQTQLKNGGMSNPQIYNVMHGASKQVQNPKVTEPLDYDEVGNVLSAVVEQAGKRAEQHDALSALAEQLRPLAPGQRSPLIRQAIAQGVMPKPDSPEFEGAVQSLTRMVIGNDRGQQEKLLAQLSPPQRAQEMYRILHDVPENERPVIARQWAKNGLITPAVSAGLGQLVEAQPLPK